MVEVVTGPKAPRPYDKHGGAWKKRMKVRPSGQKIRREVSRDVGPDPGEVVYPFFWWTPGRCNPPPELRGEYRRFKSMVEGAGLEEHVDAAWDPEEELWAVWARNPAVTVDYCRGWWRLFFVKSDGAYYPLDSPVVMATIFERDFNSRNMTSLEYYDRVAEEVRRERESVDRAVRRDDEALAGEYYDYMQIKNIGRGDKHVRYHSGE